MIQRIELLDAPVDSLTMKEAVQWLCTHAELRDRPRSVVVMNASKLWLMERNTEVSQIVRQADLLVAERALLFASRVLSVPLAAHVGGVTLVKEFLPVAADKQIPVFFLGARPHVVERLAGEMRRRHQGLAIAGWHHGYFGPEEEQEVIRSVQGSGAGVLFVALGSPRQELWIARHRDELQVPVVMGVGGSFDVLAGYKQDTPQWVRNIYMEWLFRLAQNPANLWRRYGVTIPWFLGRVVAARFRR